MKQPYYHRVEILFTATSDVSVEANSVQFLEKLKKFLRKELGSSVVASTVELDGPVTGEPGDPHDLA